MKVPALPILILAAGASSRMGGRDKLLEPVADAVPLLAERVRMAVATGQEVLVALPSRRQSPRRWHCLKNTGATGVEIGNICAGLSASLAGMLRALPARAEGALILPADMPDITHDDLIAILNAFEDGLVVRGSSATGKPGHPVLFPRGWFARLQELSGDTGARDLLRAAENIRLVPLPGRHALTDLDTGEDWAKWRASKAR